MTNTRNSTQRRIGIVGFMITIAGFVLGFAMAMTAQPSWFMKVILLMLDHPPIAIALALFSLAGACTILVSTGRYFIAGERVRP